MMTTRVHGVAVSRPEDVERYGAGAFKWPFDRALPLENKGWVSQEHGGGAPLEFLHPTRTLHVCTTDFIFIFRRKAQSHHHYLHLHLHDLERNEDGDI